MDSAHNSAPFAINSVRLVAFLRDDTYFWRMNDFGVKIMFGQIPACNRLFVLLIWLALSPGAAYAQGSISQNGASYQFLSSSFNTPPNSPDGWRVNAMFGGADQLFASWFWYRAGGDSREWVLPLPSSQQYNGNQAILQWSDVGGRGLFSLVMRVTIESADGAAGLVRYELDASNISGLPLELNLFHYIDIDAGGTSTGDQAKLDNPGLVQIEDASTGAFAFFYGAAANTWQASPFSQIRTLLLNSGLDNLNNSGLPIPAPGVDGTYAMQWGFGSIAPAGQAQTLSILSINQPLQLAPIPALSTWGLILLGLLLTIGGVLRLMAFRLSIGAGRFQLVHGSAVLPFDLRLYSRLLATVLAVLLLIGIIAWLSHAPLYAHDAPAALICAALLAFLVYLFYTERRLSALS